MNDHDYWLARFARLRVDTASNAPHKPLLLLVVLDLAQQGALGPDVLPLTPQLAFRFCTYWSIVAHRRKQKPDVRWPFTKLKTEGVWIPLDGRLDQNCCGAIFCTVASTHHDGPRRARAEAFIMTIVEAIKQVMRDTGRPMTVAEVYSAIIEQRLYSFAADQPLQIVRAQIRRHCQGLDFPSASNTKHFVVHNDGRYTALPRSIKQRVIAGRGQTRVPVSDPAGRLRALHADYLEEFRRRLIRQLMGLEPAKFELFGKKLLVAYGFKDVEVTQLFKDGGIDGHGKLSIGLGLLNVAFQCKRWKTTPVGRPAISQFRGDIQGKHELGIYFTTGTFTRDAQQAASQSGAVPVVLLDGRSIANLMMEKHFGVEVETLPIYSNALDNAMSDGQDSAIA